jgi:hypothetical protein
MPDDKDKQQKEADRHAPAADDAAPVAPGPEAGGHGIASGHNPGGTMPGGGPGAGLGSIGTGGASSGGARTGSVKRDGR